MKYKDYYATLGLKRDATPEEVKRVYRKLARKYHPDVSKEKGAEDKFKEVGEAYEVLKDPEKRAAYDQLGHYTPGQDFRPPPDWARQHGNHAGGFSSGPEMDFGDLFEGLFGGGGGGSRAGSPRGRRGGMRMAGADFEAAVTVTLEQALAGSEVSFDLPRGNGSVPLKVRIPKGITDGEKMRVPGKGGEGAGGGPAGSLYLTVRFAPHRWFQPRGHDLYLELPVAPWEAALGGAAEVPTLGGRVRVKIPAGAAPGQQLRLAGKGLPKRDGHSGDQYCTLLIVVPPALSPRERELYEELQKASDFNPRSRFAG
ncbi:MAG: DnaJ C-terminal domain-containing protein [Burkholderiales bacterium]